MLASPVVEREEFLKQCESLVTSFDGCPRAITSLFLTFLIGLPHWMANSTGVLANSGNSSWRLNLELTTLFNVVSTQFPVLRAFLLINCNLCFLLLHLDLTVAQVIILSLKKAKGKGSCV